MASEFKIILPGKSALCEYCGYLSTIINICQRCLRKLPDNVKLIQDNHITNNTQPATADPIVTQALVRRGISPLEKITHKPVARTVQPLSRSLQPLPILQSEDPKRKQSSAPKRLKLKVPEDPEILILSSDEEYEREVQLRTEKTTEMDAADSTRKNSVPMQDGGLLEKAMKGSLTPPFVLIVCRTIRVGNFRVKPSEKVVISSQGIEIKMPVPSGPEVVVNVALNYIKRVLVSFCRTMPVLFFYLTKEGGVLVRQTLNMREPRPFYYFDPQSSDETLKRLTLLPEKIGEDQMRALKRIFAGNKETLTAIDFSIAQDILVKSSPRETPLPYGFARPGSEVVVDPGAVAKAQALGSSQTLPISSAEYFPHGPADGAQLFQPFGAAAGSLESVERNMVRSLAQEPAQDQDPDELFARSLAATLRRLPALRRWQAKMKLIAVLAQFEESAF